MPNSPTLTALRAESLKPQHCTKGDIKNANRPLLAIASRFQRQLVEYRALLNEIEQDGTVPDDLRGKFEFMHQGLRAGERIVAEYQEAGRRLTNVSVQIEADFAAALNDIDRAQSGSP